MRREQQEYEKIQKGMAEELKRQLMDILKENQQIADTRTENAIQREALDIQVSELEKKAAMAKQEVVDAIETARFTATGIEPTNRESGQVKVTEGTLTKTAEATMMMKTAETEAAGKASTIKEGGLARLVFGKGEEDEESKAAQAQSNVAMKGDDDEIAEEQTAREDINASTVKLDDIQFDLDDDEKNLKMNMMMLRGFKVY